MIRDLVELQNLSYWLEDDMAYCHHIAADCPAGNNALRCSATDCPAVRTTTEEG